MVNLKCMIHFIEFIYRKKMRHLILSSLLNSQLVTFGITLAIDKRCGKAICSQHEYCSIFNEQCEDCSNICDENTHNYDGKHCAAYCKDYMTQNDLEREIKELKRNQTITLVLLIILLGIILIRYGWHVIAWIRNNSNWSTCIKNKVKSNKDQQISASPDPISLKVCQDHDIDKSQIVSASGIDDSVIQTVSTPISRRYPAENSTTEYSYDNAAMQISTNGESRQQGQNGPETTF